MDEPQIRVVFERIARLDDAAQQLDRIPKRVVGLVHREIAPVSGMERLPVFPQIVDEELLQAVLGDLPPESALLYVLIKAALIGF